MTSISTLALNDQGFAFDPATGTSYTLNPTGLAILRGIRDGLADRDLVERIAGDFEVAAERASADIAAFRRHLTVLGLR
jgi:hypothetical protein